MQNQAVNVRVSCMAEERESKPLSSFLQDRKKKKWGKSESDAKAFKFKFSSKFVQYTAHRILYCDASLTKSAMLKSRQCEVGRSTEKYYIER